MDIIFLLIIFFLLSSNFKSEEKDLDIVLPQTKGSTVRQKPFSKWYFNVRADGTIRFRGEEHSLIEIESYLKENEIQKDTANLIIRADGAAAYRGVAQLLGLFSEHGFSKIAFQTKNMENEK